MDQADRTCPRPCNIVTFDVFLHGGWEEKKKKNNINRQFGNLQVMKICQFNKVFFNSDFTFREKKSKCSNTIVENANNKQLNLFHTYFLVNSHPFAVLFSLCSPLYFTFESKIECFNFGKSHTQLPVLPVLNQQDGFNDKDSFPIVM